MDYQRVEIMDSGIMTLWLQVYENYIPFVHCQVHKWDLKHARAIKKWWVLFKNDMAKISIPYLFTVIPEADTKVIKFNKMFGFVEKERRDGLVMMQQPTWTEEEE